MNAPLTIIIKKGLLKAGGVIFLRHTKLASQDKILKNKGSLLLVIIAGAGIIIAGISSIFININKVKENNQFEIGTLEIVEIKNDENMNIANELPVSTIAEEENQVCYGEVGDEDFEEEFYAYLTNAMEFSQSKLSYDANSLFCPSLYLWLYSQTNNHKKWAVTYDSSSLVREGDYLSFDVFIEDYSSLPVHCKYNADNKVFYFSTEIEFEELESEK